MEITNDAIKPNKSRCRLEARSSIPISGGSGDCG
jgi:hypothetical protein